VSGHCPSPWSFCKSHAIAGMPLSARTNTSRSGEYQPTFPEFIVLIILAASGSGLVMTRTSPQTSVTTLAKSDPTSGARLLPSSSQTAVSLTRSLAQTCLSSTSRCVGTGPAMVSTAVKKSARSSSTSIPVRLIAVELVFFSQMLTDGAEAFENAYWDIARMTLYEKQ